MFYVSVEGEDQALRGNSCRFMQRKLLKDLGRKCIAHLARGYRKKTIRKISEIWVGQGTLRQ